MLPARPEDESGPIETGADSLLQIPDHKLIRRIGLGSYGEVWLAQNSLGAYRAVKIVFRRNFSNERPFNREFNGIKKFEPISRSHEGLIAVLHVGDNKTAGYFYYVMELADDISGQPVNPPTYEPHSLAADKARRGKLPAPDCVELGLRLSAALDYLHRQGLVHRDIKPSNIIFVRGAPKLADIGCVAELSEARSYVGTEGFIPPEGPGAPQADVYSLGKVLYEISTGKDRHDYPELPTRLDDTVHGRELIELNEIILKACRVDLRARYQSTGEMYQDLVLLRKGDSVKQARRMQRLQNIILRIALISGIGILFALIGFLFVRSQDPKPFDTTTNPGVKRPLRGKAGIWPAFAPRIELLTGKRPCSIVDGDLNGDGKLDLLVLNNEENTFSLFQNQTKPGTEIVLERKADIPTGGSPSYLKLFDVDGDGTSDLVTSCLFADVIAIHRRIESLGNLGATTFAPPVLIPCHRGPYGIAFGDLNRDGKSDVIIPNNGHGRGHSISVFENNSAPGQVTLAERIDFVTGAQPVYAITEDFDGDGWLDLAVANYLGKTISVLLNSHPTGPLSAASFAQKVDLPVSRPQNYPIGLASADFDDDGKPDIAVCFYTSTGTIPSMLTVLRNTSKKGRIEFGPSVDFPLGDTGGTSLAVGDLNKDNWPDIVLGHIHGPNITVFLNAGERNGISLESFAPGKIIVTGNGATSPWIGDLDNDGRSDIVVPHQYGNTLCILKGL